MNHFLRIACCVSLAFVVGASSSSFALNEKKPVGESNSLLQGGWRSSGFLGYVDAVLPDLKPLDTTNINDVYFFSGSRYLRLAFTDDLYSNITEVLTGAAPLGKGWPSIKEAGFDHVDAILPINFSDKGYAYVFSDTQSARIQYDHNGQDTLNLAAKEITSNWASLKQAGFNRVDAALLDSIQGGLAYAFFFKGEHYIKVSIENEGFGKDTLVQGPRKIVDDWPALKKAGFTHVDALLHVRPPEIRAGFVPARPLLHYLIVFSGTHCLFMYVSQVDLAQYLLWGPVNTAGRWEYLR